MPALYRTLLLTLAAACCVAPGFADTPREAAPASAKEDAKACSKDCTKDCSREDARDDARNYRIRWNHSSDFAWQVQLDSPAKNLGRTLDERTGMGLGMQWTRYRSNGFANRTRLEWNVFPQGNPVGVGGVATKASNYVLSFDRLYHVSGEDRGAYLLAGLGAVRWFMAETPAAGAATNFHTTKLAVTGGAGYRFNRSVSAEARYLVSTVNTTYDGNVVQGVVGMRF